MVKKVFRYIYRYGQCAFICRCFDRGYRPRRMGLGWMLRHGVYRVGALWAIPTRKSWRVRKLLRGAKRVRIFLTVAEWWGGGAVYYLNQQIAGFEKGQISLVVSPAGFARCLTVRMYDGPEMVERFYVNELAALGWIGGAAGVRALPRGGESGALGDRALPCGGESGGRGAIALPRVDDIVVSTVVAWHDVVGRARIDHVGIAELMRQILGLKHALGCKLLYLLHDYYCVCPRLFLVGDDGRYCRSEYTGERCNACCAADVYCADQIAGGTDVLSWRRTMESFLTEAEEIRAFCSDTVDRMKSVFPLLDYTLVPHPEPTAIKRQPVVQYDEMRVGLVGNISQNKGVDEVAALAAWLKVNHPDDRLTVIGNWCSEKSCPKNVVTTGSYQQESLPELVERTGVNVVLFSSTFPETFSYVMHEIIQLGLPVVSFDRGAQKDCAMNYENGRVSPSLEPAVVWKTLCDLFADVRQKNVVHAS